jgi:hypothetical protein
MPYLSDEIDRNFATFDCLSESASSLLAEASCFGKQMVE